MKYSLCHALAEVFDYQQRRPAAIAAGKAALERLYPVALGHSGQSEVIGNFLLGLYDGDRHRFNLTQLRRLDLALFDDCMLVLAMDYLPEVEIHERIPGNDSIWRQLHEQWDNKAVTS